jgi:hypothetical protein
MRTLIALFIGALMVGAMTSGASAACCNKCATKCGCEQKCGCEKSCGCSKCKSDCCTPAKKQVCSAAELMDYNCPCVPICCLCVRVDFCGCESGPMTVTFRGKDGEWGTFDVNSCEECYTFEDDHMANMLDEVVFTPKDGSSATITGIKIWTKLGCGDKVTLANFDLFDAVTVGGEKGCSEYVVF